jgi:primosomal protein N' (replication factor Y)
MAASKAKQATPSLLDAPEVRTTRVATVALLKPIDKAYSYRIPDNLATALQPGMRMTVPFGRRDLPTTAFCLSVSEQAWDSTLKPVLDLIDDEPLLDAGLLELGQWTSRYYAAPLGRTLDLMVPTAAKRQAGWRRVRLAVLAAQVEGGGDIRRSPKQAAVLAALASAGGEMPVAQCAEAACCTTAVITALAKKGCLTIVTRRQRVPPDDHGIERNEPTYELNNDQTRAIEQIAGAMDSASFCVQVLFGVTGSGKTEVYIAAMRRALAAGKQAIMLVPEIALTTQTVRRLQERFDRVATIHSGLTGVQRSRVWAAVRAGDIPVVIGTQSAVFAPCPDPGVIIVDEEAEPSYKSLSAPRYHTRDIAVKRGHILGVPVVLGSATPSLETWDNLQRKKHYHLIRLPRRVRGLAMPKVHLVDMRIEQHARRGMHVLSRAMEMHLTHTLERKEQAVLLLNRRG